MSMVPVNSTLPINTTINDTIIIDVLNGIEGLYFWINIPEYKYVILKNNKEQSPINGISGKNFAVIAIVSEKNKSVNVPILGNRRARIKEIDATITDAKSNSLINQKGRINSS